MGGVAHFQNRIVRDGWQHRRALLWGSTMQLSLVVDLTIIAICTWVNTIGSLIPLVTQKVGIDPVVVSAPLITTLVDATGLAIYLLIA